MKARRIFYFLKQVPNIKVKYAKILFVFSSFCFLTVSCTEKDVSYHLNTGLAEYRKLRNVNETILDGYSVQKLAFNKQDTTNYFIFQLNDDAQADTISKYGLGVVFYMDKILTEKNKGFIMHQTQPEMQTFGKYKYVIEPMNLPTSYLDSIHIYLSGRAGYNGVIGKMITLKNIEL